MNGKPPEIRIGEPHDCSVVPNGKPITGVGFICAVDGRVRHGYYGLRGEVPHYYGVGLGGVETAGERADTILTNEVGQKNPVLMRGLTETDWDTVSVKMENRSGGVVGVVPDVTKTV